MLVYVILSLSKSTWLSTRATIDDRAGIPDVETTVIQQMVPIVVPEKLKPTIPLLAGPTEPPAPLAQILVILTNHEGRDDDP